MAVPLSARYHCASRFCGDAFHNWPLPRIFAKNQKVDFKINWYFSGALNFINREERFASYRSWLNQFYSVAREENRDTILKALREAQGRFPGMSRNLRR